MVSLELLLVWILPSQTPLYLDILALAGLFGLYQGVKELIVLHIKDTVQQF